MNATIREMDIEHRVEFAARECLSARVRLKDGREWGCVPLGINNPLHPGKDFGLDVGESFSDCLGVDFDEVENLVLLDPFTSQPMPEDTEEWFSDID
jgi:hypothetical protein